MYPSILTESTLTVVFNEGPLIVDKTHPNWDKCVELLKEGNWDKLKTAMNTEVAVREFIDSDEKLSIQDCAIFYEDRPVHNYVTTQILKFIEEGLPVKPLSNFLVRLMSNPSKHVIDQLYQFMEHKNMPIDKDGYFYAYKAVTDNYKDKHTRTIDNSIGRTVEMLRAEVDDHHEVGCSQGLHAGSIDYVKKFANEDDRIVIVKIDPADVVTVPREDTTKLRCCRYKVIEDFTDTLKDTVYGHTEDYYDLDEEDWCEFCEKDPCECDDCEECGQTATDCYCEPIYDQSEEEKVSIGCDVECTTCFACGDLKSEDLEDYWLGKKPYRYLPGVKVTVLETAGSYQNGWEAYWNPDMDEFEGRECVVDRDGGKMGVLLECYGSKGKDVWSFPHFVLDAAEPVEVHSTDEDGTLVIGKKIRHNSRCELCGRFIPTNGKCKFCKIEIKGSTVICG